jgi:hypothetical protein
VGYTTVEPHAFVLQLTRRLALGSGPRTAAARRRQSCSHRDFEHVAAKNTADTRSTSPEEVAPRILRHVPRRGGIENLDHVPHFTEERRTRLTNRPNTSRILVRCLALPSHGGWARPASMFNALVSCPIGTLALSFGRRRTVEFGSSGLACGARIR